MNWLRVRPIFNLAAFHCASKCVFNNTSFIVRQTKIPFPNNVITAPYSAQYETSEDPTEELIIKICKDDPTLENKLRVIMLEIEVMRQDGRKAPENYNIKQHHWEHMLSLPSRSARFKYLMFLWKNEKKTENTKLKKEARNKIFEEVKLQRATEDPNENKNEMEYGLIKNSMFLRIYDSSMNAGYNQRLMQAMQFGEKLVIDCSYDKYMTFNEASNAGKQLTISFAENRFHEDPFDLHYCNCDLESGTMKQLYRNIPTLQEPWFPLHIHPESYLDLFPKEKLVYLTPHCRDELTSFDPDAIYIIGCMVDKGISEPLSMGKAKEQNIKMAKLPLDRYLHWGSGSGKSLTINQVVKILLDLKVTGDWDHALKHVPTRKLFSNTDRRKTIPFWKSKFISTSNDYGKEERGPRSTDNNYERKQKDLQGNDDYGKRERGLLYSNDCKKEEKVSNTNNAGYERRERDFQSSVNTYERRERATPFSNNYEKRERGSQLAGGYEKGQHFSSNNYERRDRGSQSSDDYERRERGSQFNENYKREEGSQTTGSFGKRERGSQSNENYKREDDSQTSGSFGKRDKGSQSSGDYGKTENYEREEGSQSSGNYGRRERGSQFNENYKKINKASPSSGDYGRKYRSEQSDDVQAEKVHQKIPSGFQKRKILTMRNLFDDTSK